MLLRVTITCFAASYLVALILEVTRLLFRSGIRGATLLIFAGAGLFADQPFQIVLGRYRPCVPMPMPD